MHLHVGRHTPPFTQVLCRILLLPLQRGPLCDSNNACSLLMSYNYVPTRWYRFSNSINFECRLEPTPTIPKMFFIAK